jgi:hypothetical protein
LKTITSAGIGSLYKSLPFGDIYMNGVAAIYSIKGNQFVLRLMYRDLVIKFQSKNSPVGANVISLDIVHQHLSKNKQVRYIYIYICMYGGIVFVVRNSVDLVSNGEESLPRVDDYQPSHLSIHIHLNTLTLGLRPSETLFFFFIGVVYHDIRQLLTCPGAARQ